MADSEIRMSSIAYKSVVKRYSAIDAGKHLDPSCNTGAMVALPGPSGCGKSTMLKMAAGIEPVMSVEINFGERPDTHRRPVVRNVIAKGNRR